MVFEGICNCHRVKDPHPPINIRIDITEMSIFLMACPFVPSMAHFTSRIQHRLNNRIDHIIPGKYSSWWIFPLLRRASLFFFLLALVVFFLYFLGNFQKYMDSTLIFLLDLVMKFSYLTFSTLAAHGLLSFIFPSRSSLSALSVAFHLVSIITSLVFFLLSSFIFVVLLPLEFTP